MTDFDRGVRGIEGVNILVGTASWSGHGPFYPPGTDSTQQLTYYARHFPIVEVNTSYYHVPRRSMVEGWVERTPADFMFDVKPPRELTSTPAEPGGEPPEPDADLARQFVESLEPLTAAGKLGAITFQFPPSYRNIEEHHEYIKLLPELFPGLPLAVEFRRRDWLDEEHADETLQLLSDAGLAYTMADEPQVGTGSVPPVYGVTNPTLAIIRFHGRNARTWYSFDRSGEGRFEWEYTPDELREWFPRIERALTEADVVHVFFNTDGGDGQSPRNAKRLMKLLGLPVLEEPEAPHQASLL
jgi:uncharacterized protein YecE (DUF72 family)